MYFHKLLFGKVFRTRKELFRWFPYTPASRARRSHHFFFVGVVYPGHERHLQARMRFIQDMEKETDQPKHLRLGRRRIGGEQVGKCSDLAVTVVPREFDTT